MSSGIEERRMALQDLLTHIFVSRDDEPEAYRRVRFHEAHLRKWLLDRPGWRLLAGRGTYRLERLPSVAWSSSEAYRVFGRPWTTPVSVGLCGSPRTGR